MKIRIWVEDDSRDGYAALAVPGTAWREHCEVDLDDLPNDLNRLLEARLNAVLMPCPDYEGE